MKIIIYGARSIALGVLKGLKYLYPQHEYLGFVVTQRSDNPHCLDDLQVWELQEILETYEIEERKKIHIVIATPEDKHEEIENVLLREGFINYTSIDSIKESILMEHYYRGMFQLPLLKTFPQGKNKSNIQVYSAYSHKDFNLSKEYILPKWIKPIRVGAYFLKVKNYEIRDDIGENNSHKNPNYCELTALYWIWKNKVALNYEYSHSDYYGLYHYRRILDINEEDLYRLNENDIDVILPLPTIHAPNMSEHHTRYLKEDDWDAMIEALTELQPEYALAFKEIVTQPYMYNYNIIIAKKHVLREYCEWLFPILERTEELSVPCGKERADRYIGYLGESLLTLYFMYHRNDFNIAHTGRIMLT